jgi:hypothetical protein
MKKLMMAMLIVLIGTVVLTADIYIRESEEVDAYQAGDKQIPARKVENELWIGSYRAAYFTPERIYIYDKKQQKAWYLDTQKKTYVETGVPLDMTKLLSPGTAARYSQYKIKGTVKKTGETRTVLNKPCTSYEVYYWADVNGMKLYEIKGTVWSYDGLGEEFAVFNELMDLIRQGTNREEAFRKELQKITGVQMRLEFTFTQKDATSTSRSEVREITRKDPPEGTYEIPAGYTKKEAL